ncbi:hypothetical protein EDEG_01010 [Edhazardia aedis USNM 41457]|uniref:Uncharacterized protein n=1 Tax=Edhazardia aedis (strain USNM 41457) TaxID=1003232 RepID=J8ZYN6_EDHAE|nr:hypothetical protein EDEG_01010 [Edhazardia aedis USNM 41457]|eukprot:EJW04788.1 hypothetical protein EDEG_01010 [Edhazardia aedis USNM 41457]
MWFNGILFSYSNNKILRYKRRCILLCRFYDAKIIICDVFTTFIWFIQLTCNNMILLRFNFCQQFHKRNISKTNIITCNSKNYKKYLESAINKNQNFLSSIISMANQIFIKIKVILPLICLSNIYGYKFNILNLEPEINHCFDKEGTAIIPIHVHLDGMAAMSIGNSMGMSTQTAVEVFFGKIFDSINKDLQPFGIQIRGLFYQIILQSFPIIYDLRMCPEIDPATARSHIATSTLTKLSKLNLVRQAGTMNGDLAKKEDFEDVEDEKNKTPINLGSKNIIKSISLKRRSEPQTEGIGNRIYVFFCPDKMFGTLFSSRQQTDCTSTAGFVYGPLPILEKTIRKNIVPIFLRNNISDTNFSKNACIFASKCFEFARDLKSIRHISDEKFILKNGQKVGEHDLFDDIYVQKYLSKYN